MRPRQVTKPCAQCGKDFTRPHWRSVQQPCCSHRCAAQYLWPPEAERFWALVVEQPSGCWHWAGYVDKQGYGRTRGTLGGKTGSVLAHRWAYEYLIGPIPEGLTLDHLCRNTSCVNPTHLEPVTTQENTRRGNGWSAVNARKTHCYKGHPLTPENLYLVHKANGQRGRQCRICAIEKSRRNYWRQKQARDRPA